jgi:hypothetical protein
VIVQTICGRKFEVEKPIKHPEELCLKCDKDKCITYTIYHYAVTHSKPFEE